MLCNSLRNPETQHLMQQGSRVIIVVEVGVVKNICSSSGGAHLYVGKTGWNSIYHQIWWFLEFRV
jgi:hypothetical protein